MGIVFLKQLFQINVSGIKDFKNVGRAWSETKLVNYLLTALLANRNYFQSKLSKLKNKLKILVSDYGVQKLLKFYLKFLRRSKTKMPTARSFLFLTIACTFVY